MLGIAAGDESDLDATTLSAGDRLAMLIERIDELSVQHHDFGGRVNALFGTFVRRIDRCKGELIDAEAYAAWAARIGADGGEAALEQEFAEVYRAHERMLADAGARDEGDLMCDALRAATDHPAIGRRFTHVLVDDAQELELVAGRLACAVAGPSADGLTVTADVAASLRRFRRAGAAAIAPFESLPGCAGGATWSDRSAARSRSRALPAPCSVRR